MPKYKITFTEEVTYQVVITANPDLDYDEDEQIENEFFENGHYDDKNIIDVSSTDLEIEKL